MAHLPPIARASIASLSHAASPSLLPSPSPSWPARPVSHPRPSIPPRACARRGYSTAHRQSVVGLPHPEELRQQLNPHLQKLVAGYAGLVTMPIHWGDMDSFGHVNNVMHFRYLETGRIAYFDQLIKPLINNDQLYDDFIKARTVGPIAKTVTCHFRRPTHFPDVFTIATKIPLESIKSDRFDMTFRIVSHSLEAVASDGMTQIVTFDYQKGKKADIPAIFRQAIETVEKGAMEHGTHH